jgi:hypothetical protein
MGSGEDCQNRLSALALSEVGEDPCGLMSSTTSHVFNGLLGRVPQPPALARSSGKPKAVAGGVFLFGHLILDKQNKVPRLEAKRKLSVIYGLGHEDGRIFTFFTIFSLAVFIALAHTCGECCSNIDLKSSLVRRSASIE